MSIAGGASADGEDTSGIIKGQCWTTVVGGGGLDVVLHIWLISLMYGFSWADA